MSKKYYSAPTVELFDVEAEHMIATSPSIGVGGTGGGDDTEIDDENDILSNKRQPASSPWDSSNWSTKE